MHFYSVFNNKQFIGVINSNDFYRIKTTNLSLLPAAEASGQYIICNDHIYHASWMLPAGNLIQHEMADVIEISEEEYNNLKQAIDENEEIDIDFPIKDEPEPGPEPELEDDSFSETLEILKSTKLKKLSSACNKVIEAGIDVTLDSRTVEHFSLTTQDQLNLITLSQMAATGVENIPYHADGEICHYYSAADILKIAQAAAAHKIYHTTYFNALKNYINSIDDASLIAAITYGFELPEEYQSAVLKALINE